MDYPFSCFVDLLNSDSVVDRTILHTTNVEEDD